MRDIELILMDGDFKRIRVVKDFTSLVWTSRYYEAGGFELYLPRKYIDSALEAAYVYRKDATEAGAVMGVTVSEEGVALRGEFLGSLLKARVVNDVFRYSGGVYDAARALVNKYCISDGERKIERLALGERPGPGKSADIQIGGKTVYDALREILSEREASFSLRYDIYENALYFDITEGLDRTDLQAENTWAVFSKEYFNILSETYERSEDSRNFAYVVSGASDNTQPLVRSVDLRKNGEKRRELYVEAKDIWRGGGVSDTEVNSLLYERGLQRLAEYNEGVTVECSVDMSKMGNMIFSLGDRCSYINGEIGLTAYGRVTEIEEIFEENEISTSITLGREQFNLIQKIKRETK